MMDAAAPALMPSWPPPRATDKRTSDQNVYRNEIVKDYFLSTSRIIADADHTVAFGVNC